MASRLPLLALVLVWLVLCLPLYGVSPPPLMDLPNHLARIFMISLERDDPVLSQFYRIDWAPIPNMAMDVLLPPLARWIGVYDAARVFLALSFLIWLSAAMALHRALYGRLSYLPLFGALFLYNGTVNLGFANYFFSAGLAALTFACWIAWQDRPPWFRFVFLLFAAPAIFFGHLLAFGVLILLIGTYEIGRQWPAAQAGTPQGPWRRNLCWIVPLLLPLSWLATIEPSHGGLDFRYGDLQDKIDALISPTHMLSEYGRVAIVLLCAAIVMLYLGVRFRRVAFAPALKLTLLTLLCSLFLAPLVAFGVHFTDIRLPFIFWLLLTASIDYRPATVREGRLVAAVFAAIIVIRVATVAGDWSRLDDDYKELFQASEVIPQGSRVLAVCDCADNPDWRLQLHVHSTALLVIERKIFSPTLFSGVHTLQVRPPYDRISSPQALPPSFADLAKFLADDRGGLKGEVPEVYRFLIRWQENFDIVIALFPDAARQPPGQLEAIHEGSFFTIYRNRQAVPMAGR